METYRGAGFPWIVLLLLGLGGGLGLVGTGYGQEGGPTAGGGASSLEEAERLSTESARLFGEGRYTVALPFAQRALTMREQALGPTHPDVAQSLNDLAELYQAQGHYADAVSLHRRALAMREQALGPTHPDVAQSLNNLAVLSHRQGQYAEAASLLRQALAIREQALGPAHPEVATSLNDLAELYRDQGQYAEAASLYRRALAIRQQALDPTHPEVATSLHNLALISHVQGQYVEAELLHRQALAIREQTLGPAHPEVSFSLNNLAALYREKGQYAEATPLLRRALAIKEQALGPAHPHVASTLNNLALLYRDHGQYGEAAPLVARALAIWEQALGPAHPSVAYGLIALADLHRAQGQYAEAASHHHRALAIWEQALGPAHPLVAASLHDQAGLAYEQGQYAEATTLSHRALTIKEQALGPSHPDVATSLTNLAFLSLTAGDHARAVPLLTRSSDIREHSLALMLTLGSEAQKLASAGLLSSETSLIVSLHTRFAPDDLQALHLALTTVLRRKGRVLEAMTDSLAALRRHMPLEEQELLTHWATARGALASLVFTGLGTQPSEAYRAQLTKLETQVQQHEAQLSAHSAAFRTQTQPVTLAQVQATIPAGAALVELAVYTPWTPPQWGPPRYAAYVLHPQGDPAWVDLGEAARIDRAVEQFRTDLSGPHRLQVQASARTLDELVLRPIRPLLGTARHLLIAPDGALHLVPFGALVDETQHYLIEAFTVSYLTTGRDLLRVQSPRPVSQPPLVVGHPDFDRPGVSPGGQVAAASPTPTGRQVADLQTLHFTPLPGTAEEAAAVQRLLPESQLWMGTAASEAALKQVQGPRLLHIATHGFFLADQPAPPPTLRGFELGSPVRPAAFPGVPLENPLLRAGLALAGANAPVQGAEDGLLTALEVAGLDLGGTELVVLSACDTGVGQVRTSEGVYGLRRALVMAGAASQVMSLWQVADDTTRELMVAYYRRLQAGEGRAEALRQVQLAMLASPQHGHPFYWAAFLLSGAWTPLTPP